MYWWQQSKKQCLWHCSQTSLVVCLNLGEFHTRKGHFCIFLYKWFSRDFFSIAMVTMGCCKSSLGWHTHIRKSTALQTTLSHGQALIIILRNCSKTSYNLYIIKYLKIKVSFLKMNLLVLNLKNNNQIWKKDKTTSTLIPKKGKNLVLLNTWKFKTILPVFTL